ncbi:pentapeptide repeat-containing protein [Aquimarina algiphila]|uniref:pentapeptide repeat-containing protein n=1 Tax=Aquimarina algiphila TaxID=2047982 RepID=UPI00232FE580|nr:pentapeptide repeat-containing protein [Aquimarina algiphila]
MENSDCNNLELENKNLKTEINNLKNKEKNRRKKLYKLSHRIFQLITKIFFGPRLNKSIKAFIADLRSENRIDNDRVADLISSIIRRVIGVSLFGVIVMLIPFTLSTIQTISLLKQNQYIKRQYYLDENNKNQSISVLINDLIVDIEKELRDENNKKRDLSDLLIKRIAALTFYIKPEYTYYDSTKKLKSNERGFILYSLIKYNISKKSFKEIIKNATFSHANLTNIKLTNVNFDNAYLPGVHLSGTLIMNCSFKNTILIGSKIRGSLIWKSTFKGARLDFSSIENTMIRCTDLRNIILENATLKNVELSNLYSKKTMLVQFNSKFIDEPNHDSWILREVINPHTRKFMFNITNQFVNKTYTKDTIKFINSHNWVDKDFIERIGSKERPDGWDLIRNAYKVSLNEYNDIQNNAIHILQEQ